MFNVIVVLYTVDFWFYIELIFVILSFNIWKFVSKINEQNDLKMWALWHTCFQKKTCMRASSIPCLYSDRTDKQWSPSLFPAPPAQFPIASWATTSSNWSSISALDVQCPGARGICSSHLSYSDMKPCCSRDQSGPGFLLQITCLRITQDQASSRSTKNKLAIAKRVAWRTFTSLF